MKSGRAGWFRLAQADREQVEGMKKRQGRAGLAVVFFAEMD